MLQLKSGNLKPKISLDSSSDSLSKQSQNSQNGQKNTFLDFTIILYEQNKIKGHVDESESSKLNILQYMNKDTYEFFNNAENKYNKILYFVF